MINKNQECDIISDLLPLYLEQKTSEETGEFVREHLQECECCHKNLQFMDTSYEELLNAAMENKGGEKQSAQSLGQKNRRKTYKKSHMFGKAKGRLFVGGYLFFLFCWWIYIIACYI